MEKLDLKVYFQNGLEFKTNDLYVTLQMGSLTGFYSIFRLNVNLFMAQPMKETLDYFHEGIQPIRSDIKIIPEIPLDDELKEQKQELKKSFEIISKEEELKRKSMATFKRSKSKHIINQYGQVVGKEPINDKQTTNIDTNSKKVKTKKKSEHTHNIFDPEDSMEENMNDLYGTKKTFEVKHVKHPVLSNKTISKKPKQFSDIIFNKKTTMKLSFSKFDVDKAQETIPDDFEIVFNFRCMEENKQWTFEWEQLEQLRNQIIEKLQNNPDLGNIMINGKP